MTQAATPHRVPLDPGTFALARGRCARQVAATVIFSFFFLCCWPVSAQPTTARGGSFSYHPGHKWDLGSSFDIADPAEPKQRCVAGKADAKPSDDPRAAITMEVIRSGDELRRFLSIDASLDVSFSPAASGSAHFSTSTDKYFREDTLTAVVRARAEYGFDEITDPAPTRLVGKPGKAGLKAKCGTHFVTKVSRGAVVAVLFTARSLTDEEKRTLAAGVGFQSGGSSGSVNFFESFTSLRKEGRASIEVLSTGGSGLSGFKSFVSVLLDKENDPASLGSKIGVALEDMFSKHGRENAAKLEVEYRPLIDLDEFSTVSTSLLSDIHEQQLGELVAAYRAIDVTLEVAQSILDGADPRRLVVLGEFGDESRKRALRETMRLLRKHQLDIARRHDACREKFAETSCALPSQPRLPVSIPAWPSDPTGGARLKIGDPTQFDGFACPDKYVGVLEASAVTNAFLDGDVRRVRDTYRALNPGIEPSLVFVASGERLTNVARLAFVHRSTTAVSAPPVLLENFNINPCGGIYDLMDSSGVPGRILRVALTFLEGRPNAAKDTTGQFVWEMTDAFRRRFTVPILEWDGATLRPLAERSSCGQRSATSWSCQ
jgi:hypothetical protein